MPIRSLNGLEGETNIYVNSMFSNGESVEIVQESLTTQAVVNLNMKMNTTEQITPLTNDWVLLSDNSTGKIVKRIQYSNFIDDIENITATLPLIRTGDILTFNISSLSTAILGLTDNLYIQQGVNLKKSTLTDIKTLIDTNDIYTGINPIVVNSETNIISYDISSLSSATLTLSDNVYIQQGVNLKKSTLTDIKTLINTNDVYTGSNPVVVNGLTNVITYDISSLASATLALSNNLFIQQGVNLKKTTLTDIKALINTDTNYFTRTGSVSDYLIYPNAITDKFSIGKTSITAGYSFENNGQSLLNGITYCKSGLNISNGDTTSGFIRLFDKSLSPSTSNHIAIITGDTLTGGFTLTLPSITDTIITKNSVDTLTNKSISYSQITSQPTIPDVSSFITASSADVLTNKSMSYSQLTSTPSIPDIQDSTDVATSSILGNPDRSFGNANCTTIILGSSSTVQNLLIAGSLSDQAKKLVAVNTSEDGYIYTPTIWELLNFTTIIPSGTIPNVMSKSDVYSTKSQFILRNSDSEDWSIENDNTEYNNILNITTTSVSTATDNYVSIPRAVKFRQQGTTQATVPSSTLGCIEITPTGIDTASQYTTHIVFNPPRYTAAKWLFWGWDGTVEANDSWQGFALGDSVKVQWNNSGNFYTTGAVNPSDSRIKKNITTANLEEVYDIFNSIDLKKYQYTDNYRITNNATNQYVYGFIADDIENNPDLNYCCKSIPHIKLQNEIIDNLKVIDKSKILNILWAVCKKQDERINTLENELESIKTILQNNNLV